MARRDQEEKARMSEHRPSYKRAIDELDTITDDGAVPTNAMYNRIYDDMYSILQTYGRSPDEIAEGRFQDQYNIEDRQIEDLLSIINDFEEQYQLKLSTSFPEFEYNKDI